MGTYKLINHTADIGISVRGKDLKDLFSTTAYAMFSQMIDLDKIRDTETETIELYGENAEDLLVQWLNELLYLTEMEGLLFVDCRIELLKDATLVAQAGGSVGPISKASIKAATFHNLALVQDGDGWSTIITFDV